MSLNELAQKLIITFSSLEQTLMNFVVGIHKDMTVISLLQCNGLFIKSTSDFNIGTIWLLSAIRAATSKSRQNNGCNQL